MDFGESPQYAAFSGSPALQNSETLRKQLGRRLAPNESAGLNQGEAMLIDGVMLMWFALTALSVLFVAIDIRSTPEHPVMKWAFVLFTAYSGPFGAFLYVLGCREPLPGLHEQYVSARWRQTLGSTMHCVAGDGIGILVGAVFGALVALPMAADLALEYMLGFLFGWTIFQALAMGEMFSSYARSLKGTFTSELLSMNCLMGGMMPVSAIAFAGDPAAHNPTEPLFWFRMSLALMFGAALAYPMNWWLVAHHLKHGMLTVRPKGEAGGMPGMKMEEKKKMAASSGQAINAPSPPVWVMELVSFAVLAIGATIALTFGGR